MQMLKPLTTARRCEEVRNLTLYETRRGLYIIMCAALQTPLQTTNNLYDILLACPIGLLRKWRLAVTRVGFDVSQDRGTYPTYIT